MDPQPRIVPVAAAARHFGVNRRTIYRRIDDGTLRAFRVGRALRVDLAEAERALACPPSPDAGGERERLAATVARVRTTAPEVFEDLRRMVVAS